MDKTLQALVDPNRRAILDLVRDTELSANQIAEQFPITRPAVSQHLQVLISTGLVSMRQQGTRRLYRTRLEGLAEIRDYLAGFWNQRLDNLKEAAEREERSGIDDNNRRVESDRA